MFDEIYYRRMFNRTLLKYVNKFEHRADTDSSKFLSELKQFYVTDHLLTKNWMKSQAYTEYLAIQEEVKVRRQNFMAKHHIHKSLKELL